MKSTFTLICATALVITTFGITSSTIQARQFSGGTGTSGDPYQIGSASELNEIRNNLTSHFVLIANIDLDVSPYNTGSGWEPISSFTGSLKGNGLKISNLFINRSGTSNVGLFASIGSGGSIDSLSLENIDITGGQWTGGLVGFSNGTISYSHVTGSLVANGKEIGGIAGNNNSGGIIEYSSSGVKVEQTGSQVDTGGLTGRNQGGTVRYSFATDSVISNQQRTGGLVGANTSNGIITDSYATGRVAGTTNAGGLVGRNSSGTGGITNSYSTGTVSGTGSGIGGLVGFQQNGDVADSFWDTETSGTSTTAAGTGKTTSEMQQEATFTNWDFVTIWGIDEGSSYPYLLDNLPESIGDSPFQSGSGTTEDPYLVATAAQLDSIRNYHTSHFKLNANLDLDTSPYNTGEGWDPIGSTNAVFGGSLDGAGFVIYGLMIDRPTEDSVGLFRFVQSSSITNLGIIDASVEGNNHVGILAGTNDSGSITNSYVTGSVIGNGSYAGGLVGTNTATGTIDTTYASATITGTIIGGLVGSNNGTITESYWNRKNSTAESGIGTGSSTTGTTALDNNSMKREVSFNPNMFTGTWSINKTNSYPYLSSNTPPILPGINDYSYDFGNGTEADPYQISQLAELDSLRAFLSSPDVYYELTTGFNLDVSPHNTGEGWEPIGDSDNPFLGNIAGGGNKISGLMINRPSEDHIGFFGVSIGKIDSLWFDSVSVTGNNNVGSVAGVIADTARYIFATGTVTANGDSVGGLTGINSGLITTSYTLADVSGNSVVGGLSGYNSGTIDTSYAAGDVTGSGSNVGGLVGASSGGVATTSYWNKGTTSQVSSSGGNGLNTAEMKQSSNFANWNFTTTWSISAGASYPYLSVFTTSPLPGTGTIFGGVGGTGSSSDPYIITNSEHLAMMNDSLSSHFRLAKEIDLSHIPDWTPIGGGSNPFTGSLHGGGYKITGLTINSAESYRGLFGFISDADIDSVWLEDVNISGNNYVGALVAEIISASGLSTASDVTNSYATGSVSGASFVGGLVSFSGVFNTISNSYTNVTVTATGDYVGGFAGSLNRSTVQYCYSLGNVVSTSTDTGSKVGGFAGASGDRNTIRYSYAAGNVTSSGGSSDVQDVINAGGTGGFAGLSGHTTRSNTITNSYALGTVTYNGSENDPNVGGFIGAILDAEIENNYAVGKVIASGSDANGFIGKQIESEVTLTNNYWNTESSGKSSGGTGSGLTTAQMKQEANFSTWDFVNTWSINEGASLPYLQNVSNNHVPTIFEVSGDEGWRIFSAGYDGLSYTELLEDIWTQGFTGSNGGGNVSNVFTWNGASFVPITDGSVIPEPGTGFIVHVYSDDENDGTPEGFPKYLPQQGTPVSGTVSPTLYNLDSGSTNAADSLGWNLVGNPYVSAIDWDATSGWTSSNLDASFYVWSDSAGGSGAYLSWNGMTGTNENGIIAPGQGFWVKASADNPSLSMDESVKSDSASVLFKKATVPEIILTARSGSYSGKAILMFHENASDEIDRLDAYSLSSLSNEWISVSSESSTGEALSINALPQNLKELVVVPIKLLGKGVPDLATLSFSGLEDFEDWDIELIDTETDNRFDVFTAGSIEVAVEQLTAKVVPQPVLPVPTRLKATSGGTRYQLHLVPGASVSTEDPASELPTKVELGQNYPNPFNPGTTIAFGIPQTGKVTLDVFDILGRRVAELLNEPMEAGRYTINFNASNLASGMYIYRLQTGNTVITRKLTLIK